MNKLRKLILLFIAIVFVMMACNDINQFSNDTSIREFSVDSVLTDDVVLLSHSISQKDRVVTLLLSYGVHNFPIQFTHNVVTSDPTARVVDLPDIIQLDDVSHEFPFHVIAQSGETKRWVVELKVIDRTSDADLLKVYVDHESAYMSDSAILSAVDTSAYIIAPEAEFPLTLSLECVLSDSATLRGYGGSEELVFESYNTVHALCVKAADGLEKHWSVVLLNPSLNESSRDTDFQPYSTEVSSTVALRKLVVDKEEGKLISVLDVESFPSDYIQVLTADLGEDVEVLGYDLGDNMHFETNRDIKKLYLLDRKTLSAKKWEVRAMQPMSDKTEVKDVLLIKSQPASVEIAFDNIQIDSENACIVLPIISGAEDMPVKVKALVIAKDSSTIYGGDEYVVDTRFESLGDVVHFVMKAPDSYTERTWSLMCMAAGDYGKQSKVLSANVVEYTSTEDRVEISKEVEVDGVQNMVTIKLIDHKEYLPLTVNLRLNLSYGASIVNAVDLSALEFNSFDDTHEVRVKSSDGTEEEIYTVELIDDDIDNTEASLVDFSISGLSTGYDLDKIDIDQGSNLISINLSEKGAGEFSFVPHLEVSEGAVVTGIEDGQHFVFVDVSQRRSFSITSEDGQRVKVWIIEVLYHPQIENSNLDIWTDQYTSQGWCSANNSFGKSTERIDRGGGYAVSLTTKKIVGQTAAGSLFLGSFKMDLAHMENPRMMTYFGVPFTAEPKSCTFEYSYSSPGSDKGSVVIELLNFANDKVEYHGIGNESGVTVLSRGTLFMDDQPSWTAVTLPINSISTALPVTHIHIVFSSSYKGEELQGDNGAVLKVDNIVLNY